MKHTDRFCFVLYCWGIFIISCCLATVSLRANTLEEETVKVKPVTSNDIEQLLAEGQNLLDFENYTQALFTYEEGLTYNNLSKTHFDKLHYQLAYTARRLQLYDKAIDYLQPILNEDSGTKNYAQALSLKGSIFKDQGDFSQAFDIYFELLRYYEQQTDSIGLTRTNYDLGSLYYYQDNYEKALEYYRYAKELAEKINSERFIFNSLSAIGSAYDASDSTVIALKYNQAALALAEAQDYQTGIAYALHNLGSNYLNLKDFEAAQIYIKRSITLKQKLNDSWGIVGSQIALADVQTQTKQYAAAITSLRAAETLAQEKKMQTRLLKIYESFARTYEANRQFKRANEYLKKQNELSESIFNTETTKQMKAAQESYEIQSRDAEIKLLTVTNEAMNEKQRLKNIILSSAVIFALLMMAGVVYILKNLRQVRQLNSSLEASKQKIREHVDALKASNQSLENFAYVASHDLREPLRMMKSFSTILTRKYSSQLDAKGQEYLHFVIDGAERMDNMLVSLLDFSRLDNGDTTLKPTDLSATLFKATHSLQVLIQQKNVTVNIDYDQIPTVMGNDSLLGQLFQNLIANGIKFNRKPNPSIDVTVEEKAEEYIFGVRDNGIGISEDNLQKIFQMFHRLHHRQEFEGTGIGLATCRKIVDLHGGKIWVESEEGIGSTFFVSLQKAAVMA